MILFSLCECQIIRLGAFEIEWSKVLLLAANCLSPMPGLDKACEEDPELAHNHLTLMWLKKLE